MSASPDQPDDHAAAREVMVREFARHLPHATDPRVLAAMRDIPRQRVVAGDQVGHAYEDHPLPIGHGQTISQPSLVATMTELLRPGEGDRLLEIGTGSGYQTAVLAALAGEVSSIEIIEPLGRQAARTLDELGCRNIHLRIGDGEAGWPEAAPFDGIIVTCAPDAIPEALQQQLAEGGRMVIPVGPRHEVQELYLLEKHGDQLSRRSILPVQFVPMTGLHEAGPGPRS